MEMMQVQEIGGSLVPLDGNMAGKLGFQSPFGRKMMQEWELGVSESAGIFVTPKSAKHVLEFSSKLLLV